jgi:hypothetical protein
MPRRPMHTVHARCRWLRDTAPQGAPQALPVLQLRPALHLDTHNASIKSCRVTNARTAPCHTPDLTDRTLLQRLTRTCSVIAKESGTDDKTAPPLSRCSYLSDVIPAEPQADAIDTPSLPFWRISECAPAQTAIAVQGTCGAFSASGEGGSDHSDGSISDAAVAALATLSSADAAAEREGGVLSTLSANLLPVPPDATSTPPVN